MNTGTRRMWSRRFLRAGWMIAPIFLMPKKAYLWFTTDSRGRRDYDNLIGCSVLGFFVSIICSAGFWLNYQMSPASPARIAKAIKEYKCLPELSETLVKRESAISNGFLSRQQSDCEEVIENDKILAEQRKAMK